MSGEKFPAVALGIVLLNLVSYLLSTNFFPFVSPKLEILAFYGLRLSFLPSFLTYTFVHAWFSHLVVDCFLILVFGAIVESRIGGLKTLAVYVFSGLAGALFHILSASATTATGPSVLIGSSGGAFGLAGAAIVVNPVLAIPVFFIAPTVFLPYMVNRAEEFERGAILKTQESIRLLELKQLELKNAYEYLNTRISELGDRQQTLFNELQKKQEKISEIETGYVAGNVSEANYTLTRTTLKNETAAISSQIANASSELHETESRLEESRKRIEEYERQKEEAIGRLDTNISLKRYTTEASGLHAISIIAGYLSLILIAPESFVFWGRLLGRTSRTGGTGRVGQTASNAKDKRAAKKKKRA